ncbi:MAG: hypothetical protein AB8G17_20830 [Gammaproteobacteria bacterium]
MRLFFVLWLGVALASCADLSASQMLDPVSNDCALPTPSRVVLNERGLVLKIWTFAHRAVHKQRVLPDAPGYLAYRKRIRAAGADVRRPELILPPDLTPASAAIWQTEIHNNAQIYSDKVGAIEPVDCLDALLFAEQNARLAQFEVPTEFLASVLRKEAARADEIVVVFGAGDSQFPPKSVYGFDIVDQYLADGWRYWYLLHNHTLQRRGDTIALGVPAPSASDLRFARSLAEQRGLQRVRVTNGFYTFDAGVDDLEALRER